jgi:phosphatidylserine decarboxylase
VRPVAFPEDDTVIVNACEPAPYRIARHVKLHDKFWIKAQPYSIVHMLANDSLVPLFVGGTVYQAYLSPLPLARGLSGSSRFEHCMLKHPRSTIR